MLMTKQLINNTKRFGQLTFTSVCVFCDTTIITIFFLWSSTQTHQVNSLHVAKNFATRLSSCLHALHSGAVCWTSFSKGLNHHNNFVSGRNVTQRISTHCLLCQQPLVFVFLTSYTSFLKLVIALFGFTNGLGH